MKHIPVMVDEIKRCIGEIEDGVIIDATLGDGGHTEVFLESTGNGVSVVGIDRDFEAVTRTRQRLSRFRHRFDAIHASYSMYGEINAVVQDRPVRAVLMDLGVSSIQLESRGRGFSFNDDMSLDMRFNPQNGTETAEKIINQWPEHKLAEIFREFGEIRHSRRIARAIVKGRQESAFRSGKALGEFIARHAGGLPLKLHPATQIFQALRITVNSELEHLEAGLENAEKLLDPHGKLIVITFHSLEDRIVKHFLLAHTGKCICPPNLPECRCQPIKSFEIITRKPMVASAREIQANPRARSAKLRCAQKCAENTTKRDSA